MLNLRNTEAKEQYEKAVQSGHHDAERIKIKITKLTPKTDLVYIKQYLLGYQGFAIEDSLPAYVLYFDSKKKPVEKNYFYKQGSQPGNTALADMQKIRKDFSQWKKLDEFEARKRKEYMEKRGELEKAVKKDDKDEASKKELIRLIVENESALIVLRSNYSKKMKEALGRISEDFAKANGYGAVAKARAEVEGKDVTDELLKRLEADSSLIVAPETLFGDALKEIKPRESNLQPDQFFKK